jgi:hypothetical protein
VTVTLTDSDRAQVAGILKARDRLLDFAQYTFPGYQKAPHLELVAQELEAIERGENDRLIVLMPPRHGKSELISVRFPAWALCLRPTRAIISASYGDKLAVEMGRRTRNVVDTQPLFPFVRLAADSKAKDLWHTQQGGQFLAVGIGSGVVGFGGDIITIDDPFKKREEAESEVQRDKIWNWYTSEILTRQEPSAAIVVVMHRWHEDDLVGRLLLSEPGRWRVLRLPAVAETAGDVIGREKGDPLWAWRYDAEALAQRRKEIGERDWNSLYQQRPTPPEGAVFKWWNRYQQPPKLREIVVGIDTAYTGSATSDYTAWSTWGFDGSYAYLMEADRFQGEVPDAERRITATIWRLIQQNPGVPVKGLVRASVAIDRVAAQHLRRGISMDGLAGVGPTGRVGLPIVEVKLPAMGGRHVKEELGNLYATEFESGRALIPEWAPWLEAWLEEHKGFPAGLHDDYVETTFLAMHHLFRREAWTRPPARQLWGEGA